MRPPRKWTYAGAKRARQKRVVKTSEAPRGVWRDEPASPRFNYRPTPKQARIALALAAFTMFAAMSWWAVHSPWLTVSHVTVTGANRLSPEEVRQAAGVDGKSIFTVDLQAARARVAALPNVRSATIAKRGRTGVSIDVEERTTWGSWQMGDAKIPIDIDGYVHDRPGVLRHTDDYRSRSAPRAQCGRPCGPRRRRAGRPADARGTNRRSAATLSRSPTVATPASRPCCPAPALMTRRYGSPSGTHGTTSTRSPRSTSSSKRRGNGNWRSVRSTSGSATG